MESFSSSGRRKIGGRKVCSSAISGSDLGDGKVNEAKSVLHQCLSRRKVGKQMNETTDQRQRKNPDVEGMGPG